MHLIWGCVRGQQTGTANGTGTNGIILWRTPGDAEDRNQGPDGAFGNSDDLSTCYVHVAVGRRATAIDEGGQVTDYAYDAFSRQTQVIEDVGASPHVNRQTHFAYDPAGRLSRIVAVDSVTGNQTTLYAYNARGKQVTTTYPVTGSVVSAYDEAGNLTLRTDEAGVTVYSDYDEVNLLTQQYQAGGAGPKARFILAWGNAPGTERRTPGGLKARFISDAPGFPEWSFRT